MTRVQKLVDRLLRPGSDADFRFNDLCVILEAVGFSKRVKGSHHIFTREGIAEIVNIQPLQRGQAKPYQVRQVRDILWKYGLVTGDAE